MPITGSLNDFSLPELFNFIDKGRKTGLLTIIPVKESSASLSPVHYIWVERGYLVAVANRLDQLGLTALIEQRQGISNRVVTKLAQFCPHNKPLGLYLKEQGALQTEQLEHLFNAQVVQQAFTLFQLKDARFKFEQNLLASAQEMTGLSISAAALGAMLQKVVRLEQLLRQESDRDKKANELLSSWASDSIKLSSDLLSFDIFLPHGVSKSEKITSGKNLNSRDKSYAA
jgi:hypothetical protein